MEFSFITFYISSFPFTLKDPTKDREAEFILEYIENFFEVGPLICEISKIRSVGFSKLKSCPSPRFATNLFISLDCSSSVM